MLTGPHWNNNLWITFRNDRAINSCPHQDKSPSSLWVAMLCIVAVIPIMHWEDSWGRKTSERVVERCEARVAESCVAAGSEGAWRESTAAAFSPILRLLWKPPSSFLNFFRTNQHACVLHIHVVLFRKIKSSWHLADRFLRAEKFFCNWQFSSDCSFSKIELFIAFPRVNYAHVASSDVTGWRESPESHSIVLRSSHRARQTAARE